MIQLTSNAKYTIYLSEKKEGSIHTKNQAKEYLLSNGIKSEVAYFHHQHQSGRVWFEQHVNEHKIWADAALTQSSQITLAMSVADCFPVIISSNKQPLLALIHAGWKPLLQNVLELTIQEILIKTGIKTCNLTAWIGPGIRACCYRFAQKPIQADLKNWQPFIKKQQNNWVVDLPGFIQQELRRLGFKTTHITDFNKCTYCQSDQYFSHRRSLNLNQPKENGRILVACS